MPVRDRKLGAFPRPTPARPAVAPEPSARTEVNAGREVPALVRARRVGGSVAIPGRARSGRRVCASPRKRHEDDARADAPLARGRVRPAVGRRGGPGRLGGVRGRRARTHRPRRPRSGSPQAVGGARASASASAIARPRHLLGGVYDTPLLLREDGEYEMMCSVIVKPPGFMYVAPNVTINVRGDCGGGDAIAWNAGNPGGTGMKPSTHLARRHGRARHAREARGV